MTDLEPRLHHLRQTPVPAGPDPAEVRARAGRRKARRHRRIALGTVPVLALLVVAAATALAGNGGSESVVTGTVATTIQDEATAETGPTTTSSSIPLGNAPGLRVQVSPSTGLVDGQLVRVTIEGIATLDNPIIILCAGDVTTTSVTSDCDLTPLEPAGSAAPAGTATTASADQEVAVRRTIGLSRQPTSEQGEATPYGAYDCAVEPAGCVLAVGNSTLPATGVAVPVSFADDELPVPEVSVSPSDDLQDGQEVAVEATGLRPNSTYSLTQCSRGGDATCDEITWPSAKTDGEGALRASYTVHTAIYGWKGRADCTAEPCVVQVARIEGGVEPAAAPVTFAADAVAAVPHLELSPAGPYDDRQEVTVTGTGFPPGFDMSSAIGQCPADGDSAVLNNCGYGALRNGPAIVDDRGRFTTTIELFAERCRTEAGCVLGWVLNHGPTIAKVPIPFR